MKGMGGERTQEVMIRGKIKATEEALIIGRDWRLGWEGCEGTALDGMMREGSLRR